MAKDEDLLNGEEEENQKAKIDNEEESPGPAQGNQGNTF